MRDRTQEEIAIIQRFDRMVGYVPNGLIDILHILSAPEMIELTQQYLDSKLGGE